MIEKPSIFDIPTLFNVQAAPLGGIRDLQLHVENLLKETDAKILNQNILLHHLIDRMSIVECLTKSPEELEKEWELTVGTNIAGKK